MHSVSTDELSIALGFVWFVQDVFVLETSKTCFVWIGKGASAAEKQNGFGYAHVSFNRALFQLVYLLLTACDVTSADWSSH